MIKMMIMEELIKRAEEGEDRVQYQLGLVYYNGDVINTNDKFGMLLVHLSGTY